MQNEITFPTNPTYWIAYSSDSASTGVTMPDQITTSGQDNFYHNDDPQEFLDATINIPIFDLPELPQSDQPIQCGVYMQDGTRVIVTENQEIVYPSNL